ncbi:hypothetical protein ACIRQY_13390 [Streptomyces sp. NPDC101490]|uniref:hypothetical protein n=1 Tax=Streptomyces sp. NPDC101490 TaxID=3366143 RepID=UPI00380EE312
MYGVSGTGSVVAEEWGARAAHSRALAVLRVRGRALGLAVLPAAVAVVLHAGGAAGHFTGPGWEAARWAVSVLAAVVLVAASAVTLVVVLARPAATPTVELSETAAPDLYRLVRDLADRLGVPAPSAIALTPDCDSWLEDRTHRALRAPGDAGGRSSGSAPVLVMGSPFLWWMRVGELRAILAPVVAGTGPAAHPDIAAARRFVRGLDAAVAVPAEPGLDPLRRLGARGVAQVARVLLRACRTHAAEMERGVAAAGSERAQAVDYGVRIVAQEQVGLAYAGWDRLLTRVALPAWRMGRWPARLDAGVVSALTELSRRDRLADGFSSRLGERPACDLLEEPGAVDEVTSLLAARLFHGGPAEPCPDWSPVEWNQYPEEVVDRKWRTDAARLHRVLDGLGVTGGPTPDDGPTLARVIDHLTAGDAEGRAEGWTESRAVDAADVAPGCPASPASPAGPDGAVGAVGAGGPDEPGALVAPETFAGRDALAGAGTASDAPADLGVPAAPDASVVPGAPAEPGSPDGPDAFDALDDEPVNPAAEALAAALSGLLAREEAVREARVAAGTSVKAKAPGATGNKSRTKPGPGARSAPGAAPTSGAGARTGAGAGAVPGTGSTAGARSAGSGADSEADRVVPPPPVVFSGSDGPLPLFPLQPPRSGRDLLADHVTAMVCCAAVDTAGAAPGLDWLDGPSLLVGGERAADLGPRVLALVEDGDPEPLRLWLARTGVRPEKPVRLV